MDISAAIGVGIVIMTLGVVGRLCFVLFHQWTDPRQSLAARVASMPGAFRRFRQQSLSGREKIGWAIVAIFMLAVIVMDTLK